MSIRAIDVAYDCLQKNKEGMTFKDLWAAVRQQLGYDDAIAAKKISQFYTNLSLDGRFINLENNVWNLKIHCKYDDVAVKEEDYQENEEEEEEEAEVDEETESEGEETSEDEMVENEY